MNLAKILVGIAALAVIFVSYLMMTDKDEVVTQQYVVNEYNAAEGVKNRGDDETYADEIRSVITLQQQSDAKTAKEMKELQAQLNRVNGFIARQESIIKKETERRIDEINQMIGQTKEQLQNLTAEQLLERQKLQEKLVELQEGKITIDQFNEDEMIQKIIAKLRGKSDNLINDTRTVIQKLADDRERNTPPVIAQPKDEFPAFIPKQNQASESEAVPTGRMKITPYGMTNVDGTTGGFNFSDLNILNMAKPTNGGNPFNISGGDELKDDRNIEPIPVYTIPDTASLIHNTLMTPLIGKVPDHTNNLPDPYRFKIITGAENLATNGLKIKGIQNIVWTGYTVGVRDQSCVRAYVDTVTYTFEDGRINTFTKGKGGEGSSAQTAIGYLTDPWGKPCIRGEYISNATDYLKDRTLAAFIGGIADATADSQIEMVQNEQGDWKGFATGNTAQFIAGKGIAGTAKELADFVAQRAVGAFDIIYVEGGMNVQLFIETQIPIDYDPNGRKLSYEYSDSENPTYSNELD